jgi:methylmalonyl-CoA/ethylmalonyl-CoA epimerase
MTTRLFSCVALVLTLTGTCLAELPNFYKTVNRVTWIVSNLDHAKQGWIKLGMTDISEYPEMTLVGQYRGKPVTIHAKQITGHLGNLTVGMVQPATGEHNAFTEFLRQHGDGIFSIVHAVPSKEELAKEIQRMGGMGVSVLQQLSPGQHSTQGAFTYFDTAPEGKFVLGLVLLPGNEKSAAKAEMVSHLAPVIRESETVSAYWQKLGFPALRMEHATPREDSRYHCKPLWFSFEVGYQHYDQFSYEWIIPPSEPANTYADFLKKHGEGIQHIGIPVDDLAQAVARYEKLGYQVLQAGAWGDVGKKDSGQYDYMDTDAIGGVSVELIHAYH